jgi:GT2 family glycosyltransferase
VKLLVVIVNYRTAPLTVDCLQSVAEEGTALNTLRAVVVDNASGDDSAAQIRDAIANRGWSRWAEVVEAPRNGGFAFGNNVAIRPALLGTNPPEFVLLLNSDTVVRRDAIATLVRFLESRPEVGIVGSRLEDPDGTPQCSAFRFPTLRSELAEALNFGFVNRLLHRHVILPGIAAEACPTAWVAGASMLVRRTVFDEVGLLDKRYFLYYEEVDFCLRAAQAEFACWYEPASRVVHLVGQSSGVTERTTSKKRRPGYWFESRRRYFVKNHGWAYAAAVDAVWTCAYAVRRLLDAVRGRANLDPPRLWTDYLKHSVFVRGFSLSSDGGR